MSWELSVDFVPKMTKDIEVGVDSGNKDPKNYHFIYKLKKTPPKIFSYSKENAN